MKGINALIVGCIFLIPIVMGQGPSQSTCNKAAFQQKLGTFLSQTNGTLHGAARSFLESKGAAVRAIFNDNPRNASLLGLLNKTCHILNKTAEAIKSILMEGSTGCNEREIYRIDNTVYSEFVSIYKGPISLCNRSDTPSPQVLELLENVDTSCLTPSLTTSLDKCTEDLDAQMNRQGRPNPDDPNVNRTALELEGNNTCRLLLPSTYCITTKLKSIQTCNNATKKYLRLKRILVNNIPIGDGASNRAKKLIEGSKKVDFSNKQNKRNRATSYIKGLTHITYRDSCTGKRKNVTAKLPVGTHTFLENKFIKITFTAAEWSSGGPTYISGIQVTIQNETDTIYDKALDCSSDTDFSEVPASVGRTDSEDETGFIRKGRKLLIKNLRRSTHFLILKQKYVNSANVEKRLCWFGYRASSKLWDEAATGIAVAGVSVDREVDTSNIAGSGNRRKRATSCDPGDIACYDSNFATASSVESAVNEYNEEEANEVIAEDQEVLDSQAGSASAAIFPAIMLLTGALLLTIF